MAVNKRTHERVYTKQNIGNGPYLARVISHQDPTYMGCLEVSLIRSRGNQAGEETQTYIVKYASPFFGYSSFEFMGRNKASVDSRTGFSDSQTSYGMWMVPPDVGVTVMVLFIDGNPSQGYWVACVPDNFSNRMVPGIAASEPGMWEMDPGDKGKYDPQQKVPVGEINRRINGGERTSEARDIKKPVHPFIWRLFEEGLLEDEERGITTSSARREVPSMVFGISTPGPLDKIHGKKGDIGTLNHKTTHWITRLGGSQFVMDDGDDRWCREDYPDKGPKKYVSTIKGLKGKLDNPKDELIRLRTRTGHQILLHNSEDLIYISNARGTTWIEMSSDGKIDIFARDSVSVHSQNDLNVRADRDVNIEAGRNINMKATAEYNKDEHEVKHGKMPENGLTVGDVKLYEPIEFNDDSEYESGRIQIESAYNFNMLCGRNMKIQLRDPEDPQGGIKPCCDKGLKGHNNLWIKVQGDMKVSVRDPDISDGSHDNVDEVESDDKRGLHVISYKHCHIETGKPTPDPLPPDTGFDFHLLHHGNIHIKAEKFLDRPGDLDIFTRRHTHIEQGGHIDIKSGGHHWEKSGSTNETLAGGNIIETAPNIHMNGPQAASAQSAEHAVLAEIAVNIKQFVLYDNDITDETLAWPGIKYQSDKKLKSIMRRIPMHEPWKPKENLDPMAVKPDKTDREEQHGKGPC